MEKYYDENGVEIRVGDFLVYDGGPWFGRSIDEVVVVDGVMHGVQLVGYPEWTILDNVTPLKLEHYLGFDAEGGNTFSGVFVVRDDRSKVITPEFAHAMFDPPDEYKQEGCVNYGQIVEAFNSVKFPPIVRKDQVFKVEVDENAGPCYGRLWKNGREIEPHATLLHTFTFVAVEYYCGGKKWFEWELVV